MKTYARIEDTVVVELIPSLEIDGEEISIDRRYHPDFVATLVQVPEGAVVQEGDSYVDGQFGPPPPVVVPPMTAEQARAQRDGLLAEATLRIAPLQDAVDLDEATAAEVALLKLWKKYRVDLSRIEQQIGFPTAVDWPQAPA